MDAATLPLMRRAVAEFFAGVGAMVVDEEVVAYVAGMLADDTAADDLDLDDFRETVGGFCSAFDALSREAQESHVAALLEKVHALRPPAAVPPPPAAPLPLHSTLADAQGRLNAPSLGRDSVESGATSSRTSCSEDSPRAPTTRDESEALAALAALCPSASPAANAFLLDVLRSRCGGRVQAAADWLLSCVESGEYDAEQRSWAAAAARRREERAAAAAAAGQARRQIVARYQLQAVPNQWGKEGKAAAWGAVEKDAAAGKGAAAVRFRDGAIVSTKGEKFVVEKPPEWDGGSRGKVKSKGKRGVGWQ